MAEATTTTSPPGLMRLKDEFGRSAHGGGTTDRCSTEFHNQRHTRLPVFNLSTGILDAAGEYSQLSAEGKA
ncbi:MAG: hypothetical protein R3C44_13625 [Chloroflexota bacterium]